MKLPCGYKPNLPLAQTRRRVRLDTLTTGEIASALAALPVASPKEMLRPITDADEDIRAAEMALREAKAARLVAVNDLREQLRQWSASELRRAGLVL